MTYDDLMKVVTARLIAPTNLSQLEDYQIQNMAYTAHRFSLTFLKSLEGVKEAYNRAHRD